MNPSDTALWAQWALWIDVAMLAAFLFLLLSVVLMVGLLCQAVAWCRARSNCLIEAYKLMRVRGGYIAVRSGRELIGVPHFVWLPAEAVQGNAAVRSFVPLEVGPRRLPTPQDMLFKGAMKRCDLPKCTGVLPQCGGCEWGVITDAVSN